MKYSLLAFAIIFLLALASCSDAAFEGKQDLPQNKWIRKNPVSFDFEISDPLPAYEISYAVRYANTYPYYNLYVQYELKDEAGNSLQGKMNQTNLFEPETGQPLGSGIGNLYEREVVLIPSYRFAASGKYKLSIFQYMRPDTLTDIQSVSVKVRPLK
ncbi:gliding motility lipoprotein GldH [Rhodoflexus caldus]|uniref:gliding motility lipoprotein GldH n=1 Tax=Rhodoflexus caldus TaxID=2891236 RepID=UPI002029FD4D|nr:gliding motility lipoprotein GldH [Rhodoflexus caldus]